MTLLTTQLHLGLDGGVIVFAADRRITRGTSRSADQTKIFQIPDISAGIGYFGLAEVPTSARHQSMADWTQDFLYTVRNSEAIAEVAARFANALNSAVPPDWKQTKRLAMASALDTAHRPQNALVENCPTTHVFRHGSADRAKNPG
jgi:hypothetical protein